MGWVWRYHGGPGGTSEYFPSQSDAETWIVEEWRDLLDEDPPHADVILAGDTWYEGPLAERVLPWLSRAAERGTRVLVGDPDHAGGNRAAIAAHGHASLLEEGEVLADGLGGHAELLGKRQHLRAAFRVQLSDDLLPAPARVPHHSSAASI